MNPTTQNISLIEITPVMGAKKFPAELPPLIFVACLVGGQPGHVYTTKFILKDPQGKVVAEYTGPDAPFTTQIKRINMPIPLKAISSAPDIIKAPGKYRMELVIQDEPIGYSEVDIIAVPQQPDPSKGN